MLIGVINEKSCEALIACIARVPDHFDAIELRLDACDDIHGKVLANLPRSKPSIVTLRAEAQGGASAASEESRLEMLCELAQSKPDYIDIEYTVPPEWIEKISQISPKTQLIISYHDAEKTPDDLDAILLAMKKAHHNAIYKFSTMANSTLDALRMLDFCKGRSESLIGICMGEAGMTTRLLAPLVHIGFCYCPITESSAPGQLDAQTLCTIYNFKSLNKQTALYGLLGDPVEKSRGHLFHNQRNKEQAENAVYVKWRLQPDELPEAISHFKSLGVKGLSVTMPLKEPMLALVDEINESARDIGALNTIVVRNGRWIGYNTDAKGAAKALGVSVAGKKIGVIGAGGAAKAIVFELKKTAAEVIVLNRSLEKAHALGVRALPLARLENLAVESCDILINTLPAAVSLPLSATSFKPESLAMDITYTDHSTFLQKAEESGCQCINGIVMFYGQAILQREHWGMC